MIAKLVCPMLLIVGCAGISEDLSNMQVEADPEIDVWFISDQGSTGVSVWETPKRATHNICYSAEYEPLIEGEKLIIEPTIVGEWAPERRAAFLPIPSQCDSSHEAYFVVPISIEDGALEALVKYAFEKMGSDTYQPKIYSVVVRQLVGTPNTVYEIHGLGVSGDEFMLEVMSEQTKFKSIRKYDLIFDD